jgi:salicylate hydroxylase
MFLGHFCYKDMTADKMSAHCGRKNLNIIIVGAGIAGVTAAVALRQAGYSVQLLEKSAFGKEVGAAINITPNGARGLQSLGFDFERALAYRVTGYEFMHGETLEKLDIVHEAPRIEPGTWAVHRADLHAELMRLACQGHDETKEGKWGPPVELRLASRVSGVVSGASNATVTLADGETLNADIVIGADGGTSVVRNYVLKHCVDELKQTHSGMAAFRYLIETEKLKADKVLAEWLGKTEGAVTLFADMAETTTEKHIISYSCHGYVCNFQGRYDNS